MLNVSLPTAIVKVNLGQTSGDRVVHSFSERCMPLCAKYREKPGVCENEQRCGLFKWPALIPSICKSNVSIRIKIFIALASRRYN